MKSSPIEPLINPPEEARVFRALKLAYLTGRTAIDAELAQLGLTVQQVLALVAIARNSNNTNAELARESYVTPQAMIRTIGQLEQLGLIRRIPRKSSGRSLETRLTKRGEVLLERALTHARAIEHYAHDLIGAADFEALTRSLRLWTREMRKAVSADGPCPWESYLPK